MNKSLLTPDTESRWPKWFYQCPSWDHCLLELRIDEGFLTGTRITQSYLYPSLGDASQKVQPWRLLTALQVRWWVREYLSSTLFAGRVTVPESLLLPQHWRSGLWFRLTSGTSWDLWVVFFLSSWDSFFLLGKYFNLEEISTQQCLRVLQTMS